MKGCIEKTKLCKIKAEWLSPLPKFLLLDPAKTTVSFSESPERISFKAANCSGETVGPVPLISVSDLREPLAPQKHDPDVKRIFMLCDTHNIPMATNLATAEMMIRSLGRGELDWREMYK